MFLHEAMNHSMMALLLRNVFLNMQLKISHLVSSRLQTFWFNFNFFVLNFDVLKSAFKKSYITQVSRGKESV